MSVLPTVMTVDSSAESREVLKALLEYQGINTVEAANIQQAVQLLDSEKTDVVIVDFDTIELKEKDNLVPLWHKSALSDTPIVILGTNRPSIPTELVCDFVRKPYHYQQLLHKILEHLGRTSQVRISLPSDDRWEAFDTAIPRKAA